MIFFEYVLKNYNEAEYKLHKDSNLSILKIYLLINQNISDSYSTNERIKDPLSIVIKSQFGKYSFKYFDISKHFVSQCIKFSLLDTYLDKNTYLKTLKGLFLNQYKLNDWKDYLYKIIELLKYSFNKLKIIIPTEEKQYYDILISKIDNYNPIGQFIELRKSPLIPFDKDTFLIPFTPFIVNKLNDTIYFNFKELISKNQNQFHDIDSKDFKGRFDYEFSEQFVFYSAIKLTFADKYIQKTGEELNFVGSIDYYIRNGKKILLFEHKATLISDNAKTKNRYSIIEKELFDKLVKKGVSQLLNNIEKIANGDYSQYDNQLNYNKSTIYPILVITDDSITDPGVNMLFRKWWKEELYKREKICGNIKIKDIILLHINDLLYYQFYIRKIDVIIKEYFKYVKTNKGADKYKSFSEYIEKYLDKNNTQYKTNSLWTNFLIKYFDNQ